MAFRKQEVCYGQASTIVQERHKELEHDAVARMDTKECLSESNMYVMDRLVQWFKRDLQNSSTLQ